MLGVAVLGPQTGADEETWEVVVAMVDQSSCLAVRRADPAKNSKGCTPMGCKEDIKGLGHEERALMVSLL